MPNNALPQKLYRCSAVRELDRLAIEDQGIPGVVLMKRAAKAAFSELLKRWPAPGRVIVACGSGNNAGDGYILAALAAQRCIDVSVFHVTDPSQLEGDAQAAYEYALQENVEVQPFSDLDIEELNADCVIVDALLGIGLCGEVRDEYRQAIDLVNAANLPVLALDIPSGLCGDTGNILGIAIRAHTTITFIACKQGLLTGRGPVVSGDVVCDDLGLPSAVFTGVSAETERLELNDLLDRLPLREADAHKGCFGHCLVIGGDHGLGGAAIMAAESAAYTGAGSVSLATQPAHVAPALVRTPEVMALGVVSGQELEPNLAGPSVLVVGPGLGQSPWGEQMFMQACKADLPMVVDADGLNLLASRFRHRASRGNWVLTPHAGEAARLLDCSVEAVLVDRFSAVTKIQKMYGGVVVLKGAGTLVASESGIALADVGNPGMATAGSGDVLSGIIGSLIAQGLALDVAAQLGVCLHGTAGDLAAEELGQRGLQATCMIPYVRELIN